MPGVCPSAAGSLHCSALHAALYLLPVPLPLHPRPGRNKGHVRHREARKMLPISRFARNFASGGRLQHRARRLHPSLGSGGNSGNGEGEQSPPSPSDSPSAPPREYVHRQYLLALAKANVLPRLMEDELRMKEMGIPVEEYGRLMRKEENHGMKGFDLVKGLLYRVDWRDKELEEMVWKSVERIDRADRTGARGDRYGRVSSEVGGRSAAQPRAPWRPSSSSPVTQPSARVDGPIPRGNSQNGRVSTAQSGLTVAAVDAASSASSLASAPNAAGPSRGGTKENGSIAQGHASGEPVMNKGNIVDLLASTYHISLPGNAQPGTEHRVLCPQCGGACRDDKKKLFRCGRRFVAVVVWRSLDNRPCYIALHQAGHRRRRASLCHSMATDRRPSGTVLGRAVDFPVGRRGKTQTQMVWCRYPRGRKSRRISPSSVLRSSCSP